MPSLLLVFLLPAKPPLPTTSAASLITTEISNMSFDTNWTTFVGGITRDPELKLLPSGTPVLNLGIAVNHGKKDKDGNWSDENVAESLGRGDRVIVVARASYRQWETSDGDKRSKVEFVASSVGPDLSRATAEVTKIRREDG
jgi:single-strand DNA-binding protein